MNLLDLFDLSLVGRRDEIALEFEGRSFTFGEIAERSSRMAEALRRRGVGLGDRLCVYLANCVEMIDLYLACLKLGAIFVPINILYREREIAHIVSRRRAECRRHARRLGCQRAGVAAGRTAGRRSAARRAHGARRRRAPAALVYTSGTTGVSKGAILTHNNFASNAINLLTCWQITPADRLLLALPLFHVHALANGLHCWLIGGFRVRLLERFEREKAAGEFLDFQPTLFFGVPTMYVRLLETPPETARDIGAPMRLFVSGSAPLPAQVLEDFRALFGHTILERYGMTETLMNMSNPYVGERRPGSVGLPLPGVVECALVRRRAKSICAAPMSSRVTGGAKRRRASVSWTAGSERAISLSAPPMATTRSAGARAI